MGSSVHLCYFQRRWKEAQELLDRGLKLVQEFKTVLTCTLEQVQLTQACQYSVLWRNPVQPWVSALIVKTGDATMVSVRPLMPG